MGLVCLCARQGTDLSEDSGPIPPANPNARINPKTTPFSRENSYNQPTTQKPVIYQFRKNSLLISALIAAAYEKVKICARIQWPKRIHYRKDAKKNL
jgi:hypothetical protein